MKRKALIIGSSQIGSASPLPGVQKDVENYKKFLMSPLGGAWHSEEIKVLIDPFKSDVLAEQQLLKQANYSLVIFGGHGTHPVANGPTHVELRKDVKMTEYELKIGAPKHLLILDCCRKLQRKLITDSLMAKRAEFAEATYLTPSLCRHYYDQHLQRCPDALVTLYGCDIDQVSNETAEDGGAYSSSLMKSAQSWRESTRIPSGQNFSVLEITESHAKAAELVRVKSGGRQTPKIDYPRSSPYFPFAIMA